jgi:hypothetical protein
MTRGMAEDGWRLARARLADALGARAANPNIPLAEALYWLSVVEDDEEKKIGSSAYYGHRSGSTDGETVGALVFARNLITHELIIPAELHVRGAYGSAAYGSAAYGGSAEWHWKRRSELGNPTDKYGRDALYDKHVAGGHVDSPLQAAERFFGF